MLSKLQRKIVLTCFVFSMNRTRYHKWQDIEELFTAKGWFGGTKLKPIIPFDKVVPFLQEKGAPRDVRNFEHVQ